ncbi:hypothetical protein [Capnocytophaga canis]|uniref:hypothetical protein n=1 Tax=Capnocytophaga canis TaxID=1848903 RepID=UPI001561D463|nr:hypothetical protein [Capnocytophaga canis]
MNREQLEQRKQAIQQRIREIQTELQPTIYRQSVFGILGAVAVGVWAWKTKQKWYIKGAAILGGNMCANVISNLFISSKKYNVSAEIRQLQTELNDIERKLMSVNLREAIANDYKLSGK